MRGWPGVAEDLIVQRDVMLAEYTRGRLHVAHLSTGASADLVRQARRRGLRVTCEVTPHHLTLTDEAVGDYDTAAKMNPPLRPQADVDALRRALVDGTVAAIATDHAPHHADEKFVEFAEAPFGVIGLETAVAVCLDRLVHAGVLPLPRLVELFTSGPAAVLGVDAGTLRVGAPGDVTVLDVDRTIRIEPDRFRSKSRNTPFAGWELRGAAVLTIVGGRIVHDAR
jgi:dihydroorotase